MAGQVDAEMLELSPKTMMHRIRSHGAAQVASELTDAQWVAVRKEIEKGSTSWLAVASDLYSGTDAGDSELLIAAVGVALVRVPARVLRTSAAQMPIEGICGYPDLTDPRTDTRQKTESYLSDRLVAVDKVTANDVAAKRRECIDVLRRTRDEVQSAGGPFGAKR